ncbi:MAG: hypothetical protein ABRQ38_12865 [Candidatus Eremiobacterota bacterium]
MRILYYGPGGGTGHIVRGYSILRELKREHELFMIASSPYVHILNNSSISVFKIPGSHENTLDNSVIIKNIIDFINPALLIVDTFYYGYYGELLHYLQLKSLKKIFVFRDRQDEMTHPDLSCYDIVIIPDPSGYRRLPEEKLNFIRTGYIVCRKPDELKPAHEALLYLRVSSPGKKIILVMHSGYGHEGENLFHMASKAVSEMKREDLIVRFASMKPLSDAKLSPYHINYFPAVELLKPVDIVISGGGYNTCHEVSMAGKKRILTAFNRQIDDQSVRISSEKYIFTDRESLKECLTAAIEDESHFLPVPEFYNGSSMVAALIEEF